MKTFLVSYADGPVIHRLNQVALVRSAADKGVDVIFAYGRHHLPQEFRDRHRHILDQPRGAGFWLWKPYVVQDCLQRADEGDVIVYADAGILIRRPLHPLIERADRFHLVLLQGRFPNAHYTKRDCFVLTGTDTPDHHQARQLDAAFFLIKNTDVNRWFVKVWLDYCTDDRILTDKPNECGQPNLPGFIAHRRDQSVLSLLCGRERDHLQHALCERRVKYAYLRHHRRRRRVPILLWHYRERIRDLSARWPPGLRRQLASVGLSRRPVSPAAAVEPGSTDRGRP